MVNNKGFIRTLEAVIAIILILVFIFYITPKAPVIIGKVPENVKEAQTFILNKILVDTGLRDCIITANPGTCFAASCWAGENGIEKLIEGDKPFNYDYHCEICDSPVTCTIVVGAEGKSVYTHTIFIYGKDKTRILRLYFWRSG